MALLAASAGCSRAYYRVQADKEVDYLIGQKSHELNWTMSRFPTYVDPRSRYFEPTSPDAPPMPMDDPAAHRYMHEIYGMKAWPCWHSYGDWWEYENPRWRERMSEYAEFTNEGAVKLSATSAVRIASVNSNTFRLQLETVYLSALDVSTERFRFVTQFFGSTDLGFIHTGAAAPGGESNTLTVAPLVNPAPGAGSSLPAAGSSTGSAAFLQKQFAAGGELSVGLLNTFTWNFFGPNTSANNTLLNLNFIQPLLRGGGRVIALERLTIVERQLLANLRALQRFRQGFWTQIVLGDATGVTGPSRDGGFGGGTGLSGFSGTGTGGFGTLGQVTNFGGSLATATTGGFGAAGGGTAGFAGGSAGLVQGFVGLIQQLQQIRNTQASLNSQVRTLGLLEANLAAGLIDIAQVDILRQNIETERANLLGAQVTLANTLDNFKVNTLGVPPNMPVEIDDSMVEQFRLVDPATTAVQYRIDDFIDILGDMPKRPSEENLRKAIDVVGRLRELVGTRFEAAHKDMAKLEEATPKRLKTLNQRQQKSFIDDKQKLVEALEDLEHRFALTEDMLDEKQGSPLDDVSKATDELVNLASSLSGMTQELSLVQARARLESVTLDPVMLNPKRAIDIARANRLDWMNNRMSLVDTWRLIAFNANALKSGLTVSFNGAVNTTNKNPLNFNGNTGTLSTTVEFDSPLTRRLERNNFRQALISYQQTRRQMILFQDQIYQRLRNYLRTLRQLQVLMEIQRRAVVIAVRRVDQTRENLNQPPATVQPGQPVAQLSPTSALNLLNALSDLRNAQNNFMSVWLNHYETRAFVIRELGTMEIDEEGQWVDHPIDESEWVEDELCPLPPPIPKKWLRELDMESEAEADALNAQVPGIGSRRSDVNDEAPIEQTFPVPKADEPSEENPLPMRNPPGRAPVDPANPTEELDKCRLHNSTRTPRWQRAASTQPRGRPNTGRAASELAAGQSCPRSVGRLVVGIFGQIGKTIPDRCKAGVSTIAQPKRGWPRIKCGKISLGCAAARSTRLVNSKTCNP